MESDGVLFQLFLAATGVQVIYYLLFLLRLRARHGQAHQAEEPVSVIVCARNEIDNLHALLPALLRQDYPAFEIIVADDRSSDGTYDFLMELAERDKRVRVVRIDDTPMDFDHKKYALTLAMKVASHDCVLLTDADCLPVSKNWIRHMATSLQGSKQIVVGFSPYARIGGMLNQLIRFDALLTGMMYMTSAACGMPYMGVGRNLGYRRSFFMSRKGFNGYLRRIGGDDDLFVNKNGNGNNTTVCVSPEAVMISAPKRSWRALGRQKVRHLSAGKEYRFFSIFFPGIFTLSQMICWFAALILLTLGVQPLEVGSILAGRLGLLWITCSVGSRRLGDRHPGFVPLLDFVYLIYYLSTAPVALLTKKVRWKN